MVAAGSVVLPGFRVPSGTLVAGVPAKVRRDLSEEEVGNFAEHARRYVGYAKATREEL
jgi:carbonic anhydrase/acetyltransferase-like protein (isoleucine patch superfamily)